MIRDSGPLGNQDDLRVIDLSKTPSDPTAWGRRAALVYLWALLEVALVTNPLQVSSRLRLTVMRWFGADLGEGIIFRPRTRVKYPWNLKIGDNCWIGEGVWIHNQDRIEIGANVVISQDTFLTTGSHAHREDMGLITRPITIEDGAWITSRCMVTGGVTIGKSALVEPMTLVSTDVPSGMIFGSDPARPRKARWR